MNKDQTSDIKQVQRFMFDNSIYLLNMFEKKIDSFINTKNKKQRQKQISMSRQENNKIDPNAFFDDPIKGISRDLTKPIWNCVVKVDPNVYIDINDCWKKQQKIQQQQNLQQQPLSQYRPIYVKMVQHFIHRYKTQHQDESNLKINIQKCQRQQNMASRINIQQKQIIQTQKQLTKQLFNLLMKCIQVQNDFLQSLPDLGEVEENYQYLRSTLQAYSEIIGGYLEENEEKQQNKELDWFLTIAMHAIISILDSKSGATLITIQPKIGLINLLVHPILVAVHNVLSIQFKYNDKQKQQKDVNHNKHHNNNNKEMFPMMMDQKKQSMNNKRKAQNSQQGIQQEDNQNSSHKIVFQQLKYSNCSRVAFINLDGYQSQYNLDLVKYLSKYLMYVSFPKQSFNRKQSNPLKEFQHYKSQRLLRKFFYQSLSEQQKKQLLKLHQIDQKQFKRNMFILPIHSRSLCQKYELLYDQNGGQSNSIQFYESSFIKFMMEEVIMSHLRQYNPSLIIISYSGKINIENQYFVQMIKQLTVISNFRLILYPNLSKIFCFDQKGSQIVAGQDFFNLQQQYYENYQKSKINVFHHNQNGLFSNTESNTLSFNNQLQNMNLNFLDKLSIFLKVSSGTFTLSKTVQQDSYIQKYKNYKIMRYSALLLKNISKEYQTLQKLRMKANQYLTISKVLKNNYSNKSETFDKLFDKVISKYHDALIKTTQKLLFLDIASIKENSQNQNSMIFSEQQALIIDSCKNILQTIRTNFQYLEKKQIWQDFKFQYKLELSTEKTQNRFYLHIPKFKDKSIINTTKSLQDLIVSLQFEIIQEKQKIEVLLTSSTKILYTKKRPFKQALIYLINHIPKPKYTNYFSFYGVLNDTIDSKAQAKIQLKPITFNKQRKISHFQHYIDFNFYQTSKYIFLFWPKIFDDVQQKLFRILGQKYVPESTLDIFRADRRQPGIFNQLKVVNIEDYQFVNPRNGCTCYQPFEQLNRFYIFGGFYNKTDNYLQFQNDITIIDYRDQSNQAHVLNVPKNFYLTTQMCEQIGASKYVVKQFKNDFVRPRIQFQVYESDRQFEQQNKKQIFLIGGVGQKFMRPYSLISYTGNKIIFSNDGNIESIKRIKTNNLLPVNLSNPIKNRSNQEMNIVTNAQNRNIYLNEGLATQQSLVTSHYRYFYDHNQQKFDYQQIYQFADAEKKNYRQQTNALKRTPTQFPIKYDLMACSFRGKQFYNNFIKVSSQNGKKYIFQLQLQLSVQVKNVYPNYQKLVRLTGASILAIDINASMLYCLVKHPSFTLDKCILAHYDINDLSGKLVDSKAVEIHLKQIHKFDVDVSKNIIVVANSATVAVLHGYRFSKQLQVPQMILKKYKKNQIKTFIVKQSQQKSTLLQPSHFNKNIVNEISCSFFINQNSGVIICLTFKSIDRIRNQNKEMGSTEVVYLRIQKLDMTKQQFRWKLLNQRIYKLEIKDQKKVQSSLQEGLEVQETIIQGINRPNYIKFIQVKGNRQSKDKRQKQFTIKAIYNEQIYNSVINLQNQSDKLQFVNSYQTEEQYYKSIYKQNIKQESIYLQKNPYFYQQMKEVISSSSYSSLKEIVTDINQMDLEGSEAK